MAGQQRLAAASGDAQAHAGRFAEGLVAVGHGKHAFAWGGLGRLTGHFLCPGGVQRAAALRG